MPVAPTEHVPGVVSTRSGTLHVLCGAHNTFAYADEVNHHCRSPNTRPDAIVVEMGPSALAETIAWFKEIDIGPGSSASLPVLLGLMRTSADPGSGNEAKFTAHSSTPLPAVLIPLSPIDSIIEAIRCGLELDIPIFAADLDAYPAYSLPPRIPIDPDIYPEDPKCLRTKALPLLGKIHETDVTPAREQSMARCLISVTGCFNNTLFVCGMAHWPRMYQMIQLGHNEMCAPVPPDPPPSFAFRRVCVDPVLSWALIDGAPRFAIDYEAARIAADVSGRFAFGPPLPPRAMAAVIAREALTTHLTGKSAVKRDGGSDFSRHRHFAAFAAKRALSRLTVRPNAADYIAAAEAVMSRDFHRALIKAFLDIPWAQPKELAGEQCMFVEAPPLDLAGQAMVRLDGERQRYLMRVPADFFGSVYVSTEMLQSTRRKSPVRCTECFSWPPWENLVTGTAIDAIARSKSETCNRPSSKFLDNLHNGIDLRESMKSSLQGSDDLFVRRSDRSRRRKKTDVRTPGFPVVILFDPASGACGNWSHAYSMMSWLEDFAHHPDRFRDQLSSRGSIFIEMLFRRRSASSTACDPDCVPGYRHDHLDGLILFVPIYRSCGDTARFVESAGNKPQPIFRSGLLGIEEEIAANIRGLDIDPSKQQWADFAVATALSVADKAVTVIAPRSHRIDPKILQCARKNAVDLQIVPIELYPLQERVRMRKSYFVPGVLDKETGLPVYAEDAEERLGEPVSLWESRVPTSWRLYSGRRKARN